MLFEMWLIFAIIAIMRAISYIKSAFWQGIPSADPRYTYSIDDFTDIQRFEPSHII